MLGVTEMMTYTTNTVRDTLRRGEMLQNETSLSGQAEVALCMWK
jgi:hypothetical protein